MIEALPGAILSSRPVNLIGDSRVITQCIAGGMRAKNHLIRVIVASIQFLLSKISTVRICHIGRSQNKVADAIANATASHPRSGQQQASSMSITRPESHPSDPVILDRRIAVGVAHALPSAFFSFPSYSFWGFNPPPSASFVVAAGRSPPCIFNSINPLVDPPPATSVARTLIIKGPSSLGYPSPLVPIGGSL